MKAKKNPSFRGRRSSSERASRAAAGNKKENTRCEVVLRSHLWSQGIRFRKNVGDLPGKPDIVFPGSRLVVFCDGDFWHGRDWKKRRKRLEEGANARYWVAKIERNRGRDKEQEAELRGMGWNVLRLWETDIIQDPEAAARKIIRRLKLRSTMKSGRDD